MPLKALFPDPQPTKMKSRKCGLQLAGSLIPTRDTSYNTFEALSAEIVRPFYLSLQTPRKYANIF